jgi:cytoskeletal protein RodZ
LIFQSLFIFPKTKNNPGDQGQREAAGPKSTLEFQSLAELGAYLKSEREKAQLSRSELTNRTKITLDQLSNMEAGTFSGLAPVYAKGFLRSYAQTLNLNPAEIVAEYKRHTGELGANPYKPLTSKYRESDIVSEDGLGPGAILAALLAVVVALALLVFFNSHARTFAARYLPFLESEAPEGSAPDGDSPSAPKPDAASSSAAESPAPARASLAAANDSASPAQAPPAAGAAPAAALGAENAAGDSAGAAPAAPAPAEGGSLVLNARAGTWAQLTVDDGPLIHVYFREGESRRFSAAKSVVITAGNGRALRAEWNGVVYQELGPEGPMERRFPPR